MAQLSEPGPFFAKDGRIRLGFGRYVLLLGLLWTVLIVVLVSVV